MFQWPIFAIVGTFAKIEQDLIQYLIIFQLVLYPHLHIRVEEEVLRLLLDHVASLLPKSSHGPEHADPRD